MNASGLKAFNQDLRKCEGTAAMMKTMIMITTIRMIIFMVIRA